MRRSLTLAAVSIAAIAWGASAAPAASAAGKEQVYYTITLQDSTVARSVSKVDSFTVKQGVKPYVHYKLDRVFVKSWSTSGDADAPPVGTSSLTMKRGTSPDDPPGPNDIRRLIVVTQTTGGCTVGKHYPAATMVGGGKTYAFSDVTITGCSRAGPEEQITFVYGKMGVK